MTAYHCCVSFCNNDLRYDKLLSFHSIPNDPDRKKTEQNVKKQLLIKIKRDEGPLFNVKLN